MYIHGYSGGTDKKLNESVWRYTAKAAKWKEAIII